MLSILIAHLGDFQLAEDAFQDALESALTHWARNGLPASPAGWLMQTARRKAIDRLRRSARFQRKTPELSALIELEHQQPVAESDEPIGDERLRLIFTCCHPALDRSTSVALTLRSVCGLSTEDIARAFVLSRETMAQRLVRARHKIARAGIPYAVPAPTEWPERLDRVLGVIYLIYNQGYAASGDTYIREDLCDEALRLCGLLLALCPKEAEAEGLLALMQLHRARRRARLTPSGDIIPLEEQDRSLWDQAQIAAAIRQLETALARRRPGPYQLQAAISAVHAEAARFAETRWREIVQLYDLLLVLQPNPVAELNRAVALSYHAGPEPALVALVPLAEPLATYQPYHAARADFLRRTGDVDGAREAFDEAIERSATPAERRFLQRKRDALPAS